VSYVNYILRDPQMIQVKAQPAVNGCSLNKGCNAGLDHLWVSLRARREGIICCVTPLAKGATIPCDANMDVGKYNSMDGIGRVELGTETENNAGAVVEMCLTANTFSSRLIHD